MIQNFLDNTLVKVSTLIQRKDNIDRVKNDHRLFVSNFNNKLSEIQLLNVFKNQGGKK